MTPVNPSPMGNPGTLRHWRRLCVRLKPQANNLRGYPMRRILIVLVAFLGISALGAPVAWAGSPHFVDDSVQATTSGNTLTVSGKEAGLGDEQQVHIVVTATALCINGGGNHPRAVNKTSASSQGDFPVQSGKADFSLTLTA